MHKRILSSLKKKRKKRKWSHSGVSDSAIPWTVVSQASPSMGFSRQEWVAISFSRGSSWPRDQTQVSCIAGRYFTLWATRRFLNMHRTDELWGLYVKWNKLVTHKKNKHCMIPLIWDTYYCCSVTQLCPTLWNPIDWSIPVLPVLYHLPEFAQVHVHCIGDAVQPSHPLMPSFPSSLNLFQHQGLFKWVVCSHQITKILEL